MLTPWVGGAAVESGFFIRQSGARSDDYRGMFDIGANQWTCCLNNCQKSNRSKTRCRGGRCACRGSAAQ